MNDQADKLATQATIRYALAQGYLDDDQVREALLVRSALLESGEPTKLLSIIGSRYLKPEHLPLLAGIYRDQLARAREDVTASRARSLAVEEESPISQKLVVPASLLEVSQEASRRPPEQDPEHVRRFITESEQASVPLPNIGDRVFVSLAKKAGYPSDEDLKRCRKLQLERRKVGDKVSLFEVVRSEKVLDDRKINRFLRWSAQIRRKEQAPLEEEDNDPKKLPTDRVKRVLLPSAATFQATVERCGSCGAELDDLGVMEGRARTTERGLVCVPCSDGPQAPSLAADLLGRAAEAKAKRPRRARRALAKSAEFVAGRLGTNPKATERRLVQVLAITAGLGLILGVGVGVAVLGSDADSSGDLDGPPVAATPDAPHGPSDPSARDLPADRAWESARRRPLETASAALAEFAERFPQDPRAADAERYGALLDEALASAESGDVPADSAVDRLLEDAKRIAERDPAVAAALLRAVQRLLPGSSEAADAKARERALKANALGGVLALRKRVRIIVRTDGPAKALEHALKSSRSKWEGLDDGSYQSLVDSLVTLIERKEQAKASASAASDPLLPEPRSTPTPRSAPKPIRPTPTPPSTGQGELFKLFTAYDRRDRSGVIALAADVEREAGQASAEANAARGLRDFLEGAYPDAVRELTAAGSTSGWRGRIALSRAHLFRHEYGKALSLLTDQDKQAWYGERITTIIDGPFRGALPHAASALETLTPDGRYRVVTDLGLPKGYGVSLERKLAAIQSDAQRERLVEKARKRHAGLHELAAIMDKAYTAFDKLFAIDRRSEIVPSVFVFSQRAGFDAFSAKLESGTSESTLGYYLPDHRILVFYDLGGGSKAGRILSQDTLEVLLHETFHQWLHLYVEDAPLWFNEGLAEYFGIADMTRKTYRYGLLPRKTPSRLSNIRMALRGELERPLPLEQFLLADRETFMQPASAATNYATAWSFVHFLASTPAGQKMLRAYYQALRRGATQEAAYRDVFGKVNVVALEKTWQTYVAKLK